MTETSWHAGQKRRVARCLDKIENYPQPLKGLIGAKLISITNAIESLSGRPRNGSNHTVVAELLGELEDSLDLVSLKEVENV